MPLGGTFCGIKNLHLPPCKAHADYGIILADMREKALENKDNEKAGQAFSYLQENINEGAPLSIFEEYLIEMEMGRYDEGIRNYAHQRRILLDSSYTKNAINRIFITRILSLPRPV